MKIAISSGHSTKCRGAADILDEVNEATKVVDTVAQMLADGGVEVVKFHDTISTSQNENLNRIVDWHNSQTRDLDISVHFNAYEHTSKPMGTEVLYVTQETLAREVSAAICEQHDLPDRGPKYRGDLFFLNNTEEPAILIEVCFVDSTADAAEYRENYEAICKAIAESSSGTELDDSEEPITPPQPEPPELTGDNRVDIAGYTVGDVVVVINGTVVKGDKRCTNMLNMKIRAVGDVTVTINGEEFHTPSEPVQDDGRPLSEKHIDAIKEIASTSAIADYYWDDRGSAPVGYINGVALTFANVYRKLLMDHPAAIEMAKARTNSDTDVLNVYNSQYKNLGLSNDTAGPDTLVNLFALLLGLGMRESSGEHCVGRDMSADNTTADTAEAGAWQTSWNAHSFHPTFEQTYDEYKAGASVDDPQGFLAQFEEDVSCSSSDWSNYGSGDGYYHQKMSKEQPAYAAEVCCITLRNRSDHYGPINRKEAELKEEAVEMFKAVREYVDAMTGSLVA